MTMKKTAKETIAPQDVDTLREETICPECGDDGFDGRMCQWCEYVEPPEGFDDPDLEKAKSVDIHLDDAEEDAVEDADDESEDDEDSDDEDSEDDDKKEKESHMGKPTLDQAKNRHRARRAKIATQQKRSSWTENGDDSWFSDVSGAELYVTKKGDNSYEWEAFDDQDNFESSGEEFSLEDAKKAAEGAVGGKTSNRKKANHGRSKSQLAHRSRSARHSDRASVQSRVAKTKKKANTMRTAQWQDYGNGNHERPGTFNGQSGAFYIERDVSSNTYRAYFFTDDGREIDFSYVDPDLIFYSEDEAMSEIDQHFSKRKSSQKKKAYAFEDEWANVGDGDDIWAQVALDENHEYINTFIYEEGGLWLWEVEHEMNGLIDSGNASSFEGAVQDADDVVSPLI